MRVFEFIINPEDDEMGMKAMSLVDKPAMESEFITLSKEEAKKVYFAVDEKKYIVAGLALIPDKMILRVDAESGEEYMGYFSAETIEVIVEKFMKEAMEGTTQNVNTQHEDKTEAFLVEVMILRTQEIVDAMIAQGFEEAVIGAAYFAYKMVDEEAYDAAVEGEFTGFSVEVVLQRELKLNKNNSKNNNMIMTKVKTFIDKFKTLVAELEETPEVVEEVLEETPEVVVAELEDVEIPDAGVLRIGEVGAPVVWVTTEGEGDEATEATEPAMEGEYIAGDGRTIVVDDAGNLVEVKEGEEVAPIPEEELEEKPAEVVAEEEVPAAEEAEETPAVEEGLPAEVLAWLDSIAGSFENGEIYTSFYKSEGVWKYGSVSTYADIKMSVENTETIETLTKEVEKLTEEMAKPVTKSAFVEFSTPSETKKTKKDFKSNLDYQMHKHGFDD